MNNDSIEYEWYLAREGQRYGPISHYDLRNLVSSGHLKPEDLVWRQGFSEWMEAQAVPGLLDVESHAPDIGYAENNDYGETVGESFTEVEQSPYPESVEDNKDSLAEISIDSSLHRPSLETSQSSTQSSNIVSELQAEPVKKRKSFLRRAVSFIFILFIFGVSLLFLLPSIIPADFIREEIARLVKEKTGRTLTVRGKSSFSLLPGIGVKMHDVSLSNPPFMIGEPVLRMETFDVRLKFWPLLQQKLEVKFIFEKPKVALRVNGRGQNNWSYAANDNFSPRFKVAQSSNNLSRVISEVSRAFYGPVHMKGQIAGIKGIKIDDVKISEIKVVGGTLSYHDEKSNFKQQLNNMAVKVTFNNLASWLNARGKAVWKAKEVAFDVGLQSPEGFTSGEKLPFSFNIKSNQFTQLLDGEISWAGGIYLTGNIEIQIPSLTNFVSWVGQDIQIDGVENFSVQGKMEAQTHRVRLKEATVSLDSTSAETDATIILTGKRPYIKANLTTESLDLNPYLSENFKEARFSEKNYQFASKNDEDGYFFDAGQRTESQDQLFLTSSIDKEASEKNKLAARPIISIASVMDLFDADVDFSADKVLYEKMTIGRSLISMKVRNGILNAVVSDIQLYNGNASAKLQLAAKGAIPQLKSTINISNIEALPFLKDTHSFELISGRANMNFELAAAGLSKEQMITNLNGKGKVSFVDGALRGMSIPKVVKSIQDGNFKDWSQSTSETTEFSELTANFTIDKGIAKNKDLNFVSPVLKATGKGSIDLTRNWVDYRLQPRIVAKLQGKKSKKALPPVPIRVKGPIESPKLSLDLNSLASNPEAIAQGFNATKQVVKELKKKNKKIEFENLIKDVLGNTGSNDKKNEGSFNLKF